MFSTSQLKGSNGKPRTKSLFYELSYDDPSLSLFTFKSDDIEAHGMNFLSLQKLFLSLAPSDPTEYEAIRAIAEEMKTGGRSSFSAAKLLLDKGWLDKDTASVAKTKLKAKEDDDMNKEALSLLSNDAERLGIKIN